MWYCWCLGSNVKEQYAITMGKTLTNRGPDDFGSWADRNNGIAFSHQVGDTGSFSEGKRQWCHILAAISWFITGKYITI